MILTDEETTARLESPYNLMNRMAEVRKIKKGGNEAKTSHMPPMIRELIGVTASLSNESQAAVGEAFGITGAEVGLVKRGLIGGDRLDTELAAKTAEARLDKLASESSVHEAALEVLMGSLNSLKTKMVEVDKPEKLSRIAADMSKIASNMKPQVPVSQQANIQVVVYQPNIKAESHYETIEA